jgi:nucleoside-diphosphate-sugar epimerase
VAVEQMLWARRDRLDFSVIRPSWLYGPRDRATIARMVNLVRTGRAKILGDGENKLNMVYAGNVAEACILAADNPKAIHQAYNVSNDGPITQNQYFALMCRALDAPPVTRHVPYRVAYAVGFLLECIGHALRLRRPPMVTRYAVWLMGRRSYFSAEKARRELGWTSTVGYEEGIPATVRWYLDQIGTIDQPATTLARA